MLKTSRTFVSSSSVHQPVPCPALAATISFLSLCCPRFPALPAVDLNGSLHLCPVYLSVAWPRVVLTIIHCCSIIHVPLTDVVQMGTAALHCSHQHRLKLAINCNDVCIPAGYSELYVLTLGRSLTIRVAK